MSVEATTAPDEGARIVRAVLWMFGAIISFTAMAVAGRAAAHGMDALQIAVWRSIMGVLILVVISRASGLTLGALASQQPGLQLARNFVHFSGQIAWLLALTRMPLAELIALEFTAPLWLALLAPLLLGERLTALRLGAVVLGFIGVLIVLRPGAITLSEGAPLGVATAIGYALSMLATKRLLRTDSTFVILFWMQILQLLIGGLILLGGAITGYGPSIIFPDLATLGSLFALGALSLTAHYALTKSFTYADATIVAPMDFLRLPFVAAVGVLLYSEPLDPWVLGGGLIVVIANLLNIRGERRRAGTG